METTLPNAVPELRSAIQQSSSFRSEFRQRLPGYRTPSPPRHAFEPLSPLRASSRTQVSMTHELTSKKRSFHHIEAQDNQYQDQWPPHEIKSFGWRDHRLSQTGPAPIDTRKASQTDSTALQFLAALATSPSLATRDPLLSLGPPPSSAAIATDRQFSKPQSFERASKRSRSEVINPRPVFSYNSRPSTSYAYPSAFSPSSPTGAASNHARTASGTNYHSVSTQTLQSTEDDVREDAELLLSISRGFPDRHNQGKTTSTQSPRLSHSTESKDWRGLTWNNSTAGSRSGHYDIRKVDQSPTLKMKQSHPSKSHDHMSAVSYEYATPFTGFADGARDMTVPAKPKDHRGWPKGKPRGPRNSATDGKKRIRTARKSDAPPLEGPSDLSRSKAQRRADTVDTPHHAPSGWDVEFAVPLDVRRPRRGSASLLETHHRDLESWEASPRFRTSSAPPSIALTRDTSGRSGTKRPKLRREQAVDICKACKENKNTGNGLHETWINCNGCKAWFHIQCAGFEDEKKVKDVDKYHCRECEPEHGPTTYVRKSSRAHASVDYAGLHEGKIRTAVDIPDHHYIEPIKTGGLDIQTENFARLPPELVTRDYLEKCGGWNEPILIPAALNPRPRHAKQPEVSQAADASEHQRGGSVLPIDFMEQYEYDCVADDGQDSLDMVIPDGLTVRRVAELYGPEEKVDVIDVKLQEGEDRRWTMRQWADYYEADGAKPVRNVISLEVSHTLLGKLIRRPKVVRDLDLQDSIWPEEDAIKGIFPRVQFYCLMSVADCYTDFHIDFGGSSVYYHILKGRKTFFFIPPRPKNLKKYEDWCNSPDQNSVFLGNQTKECYRVDLYPGDTMLIPSGWIHAVWTPENSLVIGGNFLTRMHYGMQITVNEIEKATNVTRKFRYPYFQKILWLTVLRYLEDDPIPSTVVDILSEGRQFERTKPIFLQNADEDASGSGDDTQPELQNVRYYSEGELNGLPDLIRYVYRTVIISLGKLPGISKTTQDAVIKSMPKECGDHLEVLRTFAMWSAWKRGNENIPSWAYPDAPLTDVDTSASEKKLSFAAQKRLERQAAQDALSAAGARRTSLRAPKATGAADTVVDQPSNNESAKAARSLDSRRMACDSCRKSKRRCIHNGNAEEKGAPQPTTSPVSRFGVRVLAPSKEPESETLALPKREPDTETVGASTVAERQSQSDPSAPSQALPQIVQHPVPGVVFQGNRESVQPTSQQPFGLSSPVVSQKMKGRACEACRKSKHRCTHNQNALGNGVSDVALSVAKRPAPGDSTPKGGMPKKVRRDSTAYSNTAVPAALPDGFVKTQWPATAQVDTVLNHSANIPNTTSALTCSTDECAVSSKAISSELQTSISSIKQSPPAPRVPLNGITTGSPYEILPLQPSQLPTNLLRPDAQNAPAGHHSPDATNGTTRTSSNSNSDTRSRASSLHMQTGSHSPPTSPLTDPEPSSPTQAPNSASTPRHTVEHAALPDQRTPRQRKPVERYNDAAFAANNAASPSASERKTPTQPRRPSTASSSGKVNGARGTPTGQRKSSTGAQGSAHGSPPVTDQVTGSPPAREKTQRELQEEESLRLAKELTARDAGLRRRGEVRYTR